MKEIICPYCNHIHEEWWEYTDFEKDDQVFDLNCEVCDKLFVVEVIVTRIFNSTKIKD